MRPSLPIGGKRGKREFKPPEPTCYCTETRRPHRPTAILAHTMIEAALSRLIESANDGLHFGVMAAEQF